jgi:hypothetical protein
MDLYSEMVNIAKIRDGLFIGDVIAGTTPDIIFEFKISHMINAASNQIPSQFQNYGIKYLNLNWSENPLPQKPIIQDDTVTKIVNFIDNCQKNGDGLMIYSVKGQNRCCVAIIVYLMKKYFWSLEKSREYLLSKKQDMKLTKNFLDQLLNYENHLNKSLPNRRKSTKWEIENIKDKDELLMTNTYINEVELVKKKNFVNELKIKDSNRHVGWADNNNNNNIGAGVGPGPGPGAAEPERKLVNYNIENDLYFKRNVKDITSHLNNSKDLKSIIKNSNRNEDKKNNNNNMNEIKVDSSLEDNKEEKMEFYDTKNLLEIKNEENKIESKELNKREIKEDNRKEEIKEEIKININNEKSIDKNIEEKKEIKEIKDNNLNFGPLGNNMLELKEPFRDIKTSEDFSSNNNKMKLNIFKNFNQKEKTNMNMNNFINNDRIPFNAPIKDYNKYAQDKAMNINFNNINMPDLNKKYYNNFMSNDNKLKKNNNNNIYSIHLKNPNKPSKKSRSTSKSSHNNNNDVIPFIEYNQNSNIITNIMINNNPQLINNNQKLFVKLNKDPNNLINNSNQIIQNNNFININYYPQGNESKFIYIIMLLCFYFYRFNSWN